MQCCRPQCFSHPDVLEAVSPKWLIRFLEPHSAFLESKGLVLPAPSESCENLDYHKLLDILMTPDAEMPRELVDSLYYLHEMATPEGMDSLLEEAEAQDISIDPEPAPLDVAIQMWLHDEDLLKHHHAEQSLEKPFTFVYFQSVEKPNARLWVPDPDIVYALESDLAEWFDKRKRGRNCRVACYNREHGIWFVVGHGELAKREGCACSHRHGSVFYRPERHDLVIYQPGTGELQVHAGTRCETEAYRMLFGRHLFGDDHHFPGTAKYTLEPLRTDGEASLVCSDVDGLDSIRLREIQYLWGGMHSDCQIHRSDDVFAAMKDHHEAIPPEARITNACFQVLFSDSTAPRVVSVQPSNVAHYQRESDCERVEKWLKNRGFSLLSHCLLMPIAQRLLQLMQDSEGTILGSLL